jgi:hypothetical protein
MRKTAAVFNGPAKDLASCLAEWACIRVLCGLRSNQNDAAAVSDYE